MTARADVNVGDTYQQVIDELGEPQGEITSGTYQLLSFARGRVELRKGRVAKAELISAAQYEKKAQLRAQRQAEAEQLATEARAKRITEGSTIRKAKLDDEVFMKSSAADRVTYWQKFKKLYPEVPLEDEYTSALRELDQDYAAQRVERARQQQIVDLEQRVADAEARADRNEQQRTSTVVYDSPAIYGYGFPNFSYYPWRYVSQAKPATARPIPFNCAMPPTTAHANLSPFRVEYTAEPNLVAPFSGGGFSFNIGGH